jgi:DNA-binding response OmpR family regulator
MFFANKKKRVLIIDDDRSLLRQISIHLQEHRGFDTIIAENGEHGFALANKEHVDLIILDWALPDIQGIDLLARFKAAQQTKNIPILMLTAHNKIGDAEKAFALNADAYMFKPFSLQRLGEKANGLMT